jgi:two-component system LytT family response regulator
MTSPVAAGGAGRRWRAVVVDDEEPARVALCEALAAVPQFEVAAVCRDGYEARDRLREDSTDVVLLDVRMPGLSGFDVLTALGAAHAPMVIFVTAHDEYAVRAFEANALDYLLKPFERPRVIRALERAAERLTRDAAADRTARLERVLETIAARPAVAESERPLALRVRERTGERVIFLAAERIDWVEAEGDYLRVHAGGAVHRTRGRISAMEALLPGSRFERVNRSVIVNLGFVHEMQPWFRGKFVLVLRDGARVVTGDRYRDRIAGLIAPL